MFLSFYFQDKLILKGFESSDWLVTKQKTYIFQGKTKNIKTILINGKEVTLDIHKNFTKKVYLFPSENIYLFEIFSKSGKHTKRLIHLYRE